MQLLLLHDEQVIETLASHTAQKALTDGIGPLRVIGHFQDLDAAGLDKPRESHPNLLSLSRMRYYGHTPKAVASRSCWAAHASVGERVTPM